MGWFVKIMPQNPFPKDIHVQISPDRSDPLLTDEQIQYATLDAWASLKIYERLNSMQIPVPVSFKNPLPLVYQIFIFHEDFLNYYHCSWNYFT
jgi:hypothetical protein